MWYSSYLENDDFIIYRILIEEVKRMEFDTIAAISTPMGEGAIAIVRLSGDKAIQIAEKLFQSISGKRLSAEPSHTIHYGHIN